MIKIPVETYSRVVGYYRPINQWNKGKREEYKVRKEFSPDEIMIALDKINKKKETE